MREWTIFDEIKRMQKEMDRLFSDFFVNEDNLIENKPLIEGPKNKSIAPVSSTNNFFRTPVVQTKETDKEIFLDIEVPGANKDDVQLNFVNNGLEIKVEKKQEKKDKNKDKEVYTKQESSFYRYFSLPENVDYDKIQADYKNGVVSVKIPKKQSLKKKIQIK